MKWSDLRKRIRAGISPEIRGRIDFHVARYRVPRSSADGRAWITVDREQIASWSCNEHLIRTLDWHYLFQPPRRPLTSAEDHLQLGHYSKKDFLNILKEFLNSNPQKLLNSKVPLARALAIVDRRIGKRTLEKFPIREETDPIVMLFFALRMEATTTSGRPHRAPKRRESGREA